MKKASTEMEEACLMGFSGGLDQGKLLPALLELTKCHINKIRTGQSKTLLKPQVLLAI